MERSITVERRTDLWIGRFSAMGSPCEILLQVDDHATAERLTGSAAHEAWRIEEKFSRYRDGNIIHRINHSHGRPIEVDAEASNLLDLADQCYRLSDGMFDITSGVLRKLWQFKPGATIPSQSAIDQLLPCIGWEHVEWQRPLLTLPEGMEIDLGGLGKEYAVDRVAQLIASRIESPFLVNFGGDLYAGGPRRRNRPWIVGVDDPSRTGAAAVYRVELKAGGLATSGDARRFVMHEGKR